jgi:hypothetical protein
MDAPVAIILEMLKTVLSNTIGTLVSLFQLFGNLSQSLAFIGSTGPLGFAVAVLVLGIVLFFLGKFFLKSWKLLAIIFIISIILIWMLTTGAG